MTAYDPIAISNAKKVFENKICYTDDIREALMDSELVIIATEWDQIKSFPLHLYELYMKEAVIIDGRNCLPLHEIKDHSIHYVSIGRSSNLSTFRNK